MVWVSISSVSVHWRVWSFFFLLIFCLLLVWRKHRHYAARLLVCCDTFILFFRNLKTANSLNWRTSSPKEEHHALEGEIWAWYSSYGKICRKRGSGIFWIFVRFPSSRHLCNLIKILSNFCPFCFFGIFSFSRFWDLLSEISTLVLALFRIYFS